MLVLLLSSCTVGSNLTFKTDGNFSSTDIKASDFFSGLIEDLASFKRNESNKSLLEESIDTFTDELNRSPFAYDISVKDNYVIDFSFKDFNSLVSYLCADTKQDVITLTDNGQHKVLKLKISMENYETLKKIVPVLADENIAVYCAEYNADYSEEDYLTMMEYIAGEKAREGILSSYINLSVTTPSEIVSTSGEKVSDTCAVFSFKLIDFLLLKSPIEFYCEF